MPSARTHPRYFDRGAKSLIKKLLKADLTKRYGCLKNGAKDIKNHRWLASTDWDALYHKRVRAPVVPKGTRLRAD